MSTSTARQFERETTRYRRELLASCYQMLGSIHDAEDAVQETMARAWRARGGYDESRASWRTWLHRIATNVCLNALQSRRRRPLPSMLVDPSVDPEQPLVPSFEVPWLQPIPTAMVVPDGDDPAATSLLRGRLRLAFAATLQLLTARQRAALILSDVLQFSTAEVAEMIESSVPATNSLLQRARSTLARHADLENATERDSSVIDAQVLERYTQAFVRGDVKELTDLLAADAVLEMPPIPLWYRGRDLYGQFMARVFRLRGRDWRTVATSANGQPAFAAYVRADDAYQLHTLQVLTVRHGAIDRNVVFQDAAVFGAFGLRAWLRN